MSISAIEFVFGLDIKSASQKLIMLALANRISDDTFRCYPGQALIAKECTIGERQVRLHLKNLEDTGRISRTARSNGKSGRTSDEYEICGYAAWKMRNMSDAMDFATGVNHPEGKSAELQPAENGSCNRRKTVVATGGNPPGNRKKNPKDNHQKEIPLTPFQAEDDPSPDVLEEIDEEVMDDLFMSPYAEPAPVKAPDDEGYEFFCVTAKEVGWPVPRKLTDKMRKQLKDRIKDAGGLDGWKEAVRRASKSAFLRGEIRDFRASLPFLLRQEPFGNLLGGMYDGKKKQTQRADGFQVVW